MMYMHYLKLTFITILPLLVSTYKVKIGIVSGPEGDIRQNNEKLWTLAQNFSHVITIEPVVQTVHWWDSLQATRAVCALVKQDVSSLVLLGPPQINPLLISYSDYMGLPLTTEFDTKDTIGKFHVSMLPDTTHAAADILTYYGWESFIFIYDLDNGADQLQKILRFMPTTPQIEAFWRADNAESAFGYLTASVPSNSGRILLATSETLADELVAKYTARGKNFHFILIRAVVLTGQSPNVGSYKLTKFSVVDPMSPAVKLISNRWKTLMPYGRQEPRDKELPDTAVISYDTSIVLYSMFDRIAKEKPDSLMPHKGQDTECMKIDGKILETASFIKEVTVQQAATGKIKFRADGQRSDYVLNILEVTPSFEGVKKIGTWSESSRLQITQDSGSPIRLSSAAYRDSPPLRVTSILIEPFLKIRSDGSYEGYAIDLLEELMKVIGRSYVLNLVKDGKYGSLSGGRWNGMIGELVRGEADLVVAPLTKTKVRETAIDFSKNFMLIGLNILLKKPQEEEAVAFRPFSFLTIWPVELWMIILVGVAVFAGTGYGISRFIGAPDRVRALESKGTDNLSPCGSVWFTCGILLFRDTGIYPRIFTHRVWAMIWWFFCLFMLFAYVSCLSAALIRARSTVTTIHSKKTSHEILMDSLEKGFPVIGTLAGGSTANFFWNTEIGIYQDVARYLKQNPDVLTSTYREGIERVRNSGGSYAYIMESASSEAVANSEPCDTLVSSGFLNTRAYAVGLPKRSPLRDLIDHGVLTLMERGILRMLYEKWWYNSSTLCEDPNRDLLPKIYSSSMSLHEVSGVFYLFIILLLVSVAAATVEYYVRTRRISME